MKCKSTFKSLKKISSSLSEVKVMDMSFDVGKVFQERLASSMGLDKYRYIMEQVGITNIAVDTDFQRTFNGFYKVRSFLYTLKSKRN